MPIAKEFVKNLSTHLAGIALPADIKTELELEKWIGLAVRAFTQKTLHIPARDLAKIVYSHGETREEKALWTASKLEQNVVAYGCANTSDIFITHPHIGSVYIEIKFSKSRSATSNSLPGDIQRAIGQSVIASLKHPFVICLIVCQGQRKTRSHDMAEDLRRTLWEKHRIALVVRGLR